MKWYYRIKIKDQFKEETTPELVNELCSYLSIDLKSIASKIEKLNEDWVDGVLDDLETVKGNFDFLMELSSGEIKEPEWDDYNFDGDFEGLFNSYLEDLYDLCDSKVEIRKTKFKLIWVD